MRTDKKQRLKQLRRFRIRKKVIGTAERPRMAVRFTGRHIHVQLIDDSVGQTLAAASTLCKALAETPNLGANVVSAKKIGELVAEAAKGKGIQKVVFDRAGARYHGKVKALADAAREGGLQF
jgi:large subunit ribosomal protein L18